MICAHRYVSSWTVGVSLALLTLGCPAGPTTTTTRASIAGQVELVGRPGLNDLSRVRVDIGRGEGGTIVDENGEFEITDLEPDVYELTVTYVGGLSPLASRSAYQRVTQRVVARAGGEVNVGIIRLRLAEADVTGVVKLPDDTPLPDAEVTLTMLDGTRTVRTDALGGFTIPDVPVGNHTVHARGGDTAVASTSACATPVDVLEEPDPANPKPVVVEDLVLARAGASFLDAQDDLGQAEVARKSGTTWILSLRDENGTRTGRNSITVRVLAGYLRLARAWPAGAEMPAFTPQTSDAMVIENIAPGATPWQFQFADGCGYESPIYSLTLVRDEEPPVITTFSVAGGAGVTRSPDLPIILTAGPDLSGDVRMRLAYCTGDDAARTCTPADLKLSDTAPFSPLQTLQTLSVPSDGAYTIQAQLEDAVGLRSTVVTRDVEVDANAPPAPTITITEASAGEVRTRNITVMVAWPEAGDPHQLRVGVDDVSGAAFEAWRAAVPLTLVGDDGPRTIVAQVRDRADNESTAAMVTVQLVTRGSASGVVTLESGAPAAGTQIVGPGGANATADSAGAFTISGLPEGLVHLDIIPVEPNHAASSVDVVVSAGETTAVAPVILHRQTGSLEGVVLLSGRGTGAHGSTIVTAEPLTAGVSAPAPAVTAGDGTWSLRGVPVGQYVVRAQAQGFASATLGTVDVAAGAVTTLATAVLARDNVLVSVASSDALSQTGFTRTQDVLISINVDGAVSARISESGSFSGDPVAIVAGQPLEYRLQDGTDGERALSIEVNSDTAPPRVLNTAIVLDRAPPSDVTSSVHINGGVEFTRLGDVTVTVTAVDETSGVDHMTLAWEGLAAEEGPLRAALVRTVPEPAVDGLKRLSLTLRDRAGNVSAPLTATVYLDTQAPAGTAVLAGSFPPDVTERVVWSPSVLLQLGGTDGCDDAYPADPITGEICEGGTISPREVMVSSFADGRDGVWSTFLSEAPWTLRPADGAQTVYVRVRDGAGNVSTPAIEVPVRLERGAQATLSLNGGASFTASPDVTARPAAPGAVEYRLALREPPSAGAPWIGVPPGTIPVDLCADDPACDDGERLVFGELRDGVGNVRSTVERVTLDQTAPTLVLLSVAEAPVTTTGTVTVRVQAVDARGIADMIVANAPITGSETPRGYDESPFLWDLPRDIDGKPVDGTHTVYVRVRDPLGNGVDGSVDVTVDTQAPGAPSGLVATPRAGRFPVGPIASDGATNDAFPLLSWIPGGQASAHRVELFRGTLVGTAPDVTLLPLAASATPSQPLDDGAWTWRVVARDLAGNETPSGSHTFTVDTVPPQAPATFTLAGGAEFTSTTTVALGITGELSAGYRLRLSGDLAIPVDVVLGAPPATVTLTGTDGPKTVTARITDAAGNDSPTVSDTVTVTLDQSRPRVESFVVGNGSGYVRTADGSATATVFCNDNAVANGRLRLRVRQTSPLPAQDLYDGNYVATVPMALGTAEGARTLAATCSDVAGNESDPVTADVVVDNQRPSLVGGGFTLATGATDEPIREPSVVVSYDVTDSPAGSGLAATSVALMEATAQASCADAAFVHPASGQVRVALTAGDGRKAIWLCARDRAGNLLSDLSLRAANDVMLDTAAPGTLSVVLAGGAAYVSGANAALSVSLPNGEDTTGYTLTVTGDVAAEYQGTLAGHGGAVTLSDGDGPKLVSVQVRDAAGNASPVVTRSVRRDGVSPVLGRLALASGSTYVNGAGGQTNLAVSCSDDAAPDADLSLTITQTGGATSTIYNGDYASTVAVSLDATQGGRSLTATCTDGAGNTSAPLALDVVVDTVAPSLTSFTLNGGGTDEPSASPTVTLAYSAADDTSGVAGIAVAEATGAFACATAQYLPPTGTFEIAATPDRLVRLWMCVRDHAGNVHASSATASTNRISLDTQAPNPGVISLASGASAVRSPSGVAVSLSNNTGLSVRLSGDIDPSPQVLSPAPALTSLNLANGDGIKIVTAVYHDAAGNQSAPFQDAVVLDTTPPADGTVVVADGETTVTESSVSVRIEDTAADTMALWEPPPGPVTCGQTCADDGGCAAGETCVEGFCGQACGSPGHGAFSPLTAFTFTPGVGTRNLCWQFCDAAGNPSHAASTSLTVGGRPRPTLTSIQVVVDDDGDGGFQASPVANELRSLSGVHYGLIVAGNGIAADTKVVIGDFTLDCVGGDPEADCSVAVGGSCGNTCFTIGPDVCSDVVQTNCIPDDVSRNPGTYVVRLLTPDPVEGGLGESAETELLYVRAPRPFAHRMGLNGVVHQPGIPRNVTFDVCGFCFADNATFAIGDNNATAEPCLTPPAWCNVPFAGANDCVEGAQCRTITVDLGGLPPLESVDYALTVTNPTPGGGVSSLPFGLVPAEIACPRDEPCFTDLRATRPMLDDGRAVAVDLRVEDMDFGGMLGFSGAGSVSLSRFPNLGQRWSAWTLFDRFGSRALPPFSPVEFVRAAASRTGITAHTQLAKGFPARDIALASPYETVVTQLGVDEGTSDGDVADINGDGLWDLVLVSSTFQSLSILLGTSEAGETEYKGFATPQRITARGAPGYVAVADVNEDAQPDLVIGPSQDTYLAVRLNLGGGVFTSPLEQAIYDVDGSEDLRGLAVTDVDRDGRLDVVTPIWNTGDASFVCVSIGSGRGQFAPCVDYQALPVGTDPRALVDGDFTGDGIRDFLVLSRETGGHTIVGDLLAGPGNGSPALAAPIRFSSALQGVPIRARAVDMNLDGLLDVVVTVESYLDGTSQVGSNGLAVMLSDGAGAWSAVNVLGGSYQGFVVDDLDHDGYPDVVAAGVEPEGFILRNDGSGALVATGQSVGGPGLGTNSVRTMLMVDAHHGSTAVDGLPDIVAIDREATRGDGINVYVWGRREEALSRHGFGDEVSAASANSPKQLLTADADLDGDADLLIRATGSVCDGSSECFMRLQNDGDREFNYILPATQAIAAPSGMGTRAITTGDTDGDGDVDVVAVGSGGIRVYEYNGVDYTERTISTTLSAHAAVVGNINLDSEPDIIVAVGGTLRVYRHQALSPFYVQDAGGTYTLSAAGIVSHLAVGDVSNDGVPDVVAALEPTGASVTSIIARRGQVGSASLLSSTNHSLGTSGDAPPPSTGVPFGLEVGDFDHDGLDEVLISGTLDLGTGGRPITVMQRQESAGDWGNPYQVYTDGYMVARDLNGDAHAELAFYHPSGELRVYPNQTGGSQSTPWTYFAQGYLSAGMLGLAVDDLDGNGAPDLFLLTTDDTVLPYWSPQPGLQSAHVFTTARQSESQQVLVGPLVTVTNGATVTRSFPVDARMDVTEAGLHLNLRGASGQRLGNVIVKLRAPDGRTVRLHGHSPQCGGDWSSVSRVNVSWWAGSGGTDCTAGAGEVDLTSLAGPVADGNWEVEITNTTGAAVEIHDHSVLARGYYHRAHAGQSGTYRDVIVAASGVTGRVAKGTTTGYPGFNVPWSNTTSVGPGHMYEYVPPTVAGSTQDVLRVSGTFHSRLEVRSGACPGTALTNAHRTTATGTFSPVLTLTSTNRLTAGSTYCLVVSSDSTAKAGRFELSTRHLP